MKAAAFASFGSPDVLQMARFDDPEAGPGQVRVRVKACGVQPTDCAVRSGWVPPGSTISFPQIPGNEFAGVIDQVGEGVTNFSLNDEVLGFNVLNCYAELVVVPANQVVLKPKSMPWEAAGALSASGQTAHTVLRALGVGEGDTVLIHAAAGGVGTVAVQLAKLWGAKTVIGTASVSNHDYLRSLGAIPVVYGDGLADRLREVAPDGIDVILDAAGADALRASMELAKDKSRIGTIAAPELCQELGVRWLRSDRTAARLAELVELYMQKKLQIYIRKTFPLEQAADAHREVESRRGYGKVVLTIQ